MSEATTQENEEKPLSCPCGSGKPYAECCGRAIEGGEWPATAEALVRARYTAYATHHYPFLVETTLPSRRKEDLTPEWLEQQTKGVTWERLNIVKTGESILDSGENCELVDFYAYYSMEGSLMQLGERATFRKEEGKLYYADGKRLRPAPMVRTKPRIGRNDPCPCGSGKKYKKCCGRGQVD